MRDQRESGEAGEKRYPGKSIAQFKQNRSELPFFRGPGGMQRKERSHPKNKRDQGVSRRGYEN